MSELISIYRDLLALKIMRIALWVTPKEYRPILAKFQIEYSVERIVLEEHIIRLRKEANIDA